MSPNFPPSAPPSTGAAAMPAGSDPSGKVAGPAIGLLVTAILGLVLQVVSLILNVLNVGIGAAAADNPDVPEGQAALLMFQGTFGIVFGFIAIAVGVVILIGALKMKKLQSYGFAMTSSILAMIPCLSPCCPVGLPIGIWALVVLNDARVKAAFR